MIMERALKHKKPLNSLAMGAMQCAQQHSLLTKYLHHTEQYHTCTPGEPLAMSWTFRTMEYSPKTLDTAGNTHSFKGSLHTAVAFQE